MSRIFFRLAFVLTLLASFLCLPSLSIPAQAQVDFLTPNVLTQHNDNSRTGQNLNETILNTSNVNTSTFGKLFTRAVDGEIYAQPLYVSGVLVPGQGIHNVVYVATMNNTVYAYDADDPAQYAPLWSVNLGPPVPSADVQCCCTDISVRIGILSTPVIDLTSNTIYLLSRNKNADGTYHQWLNALDITSGAAKLPAVEITATYQSLTFDPKIQNQRAALTLSNGNLYIAWASHNDCGPYHGWVMSYSASTLTQNGVYVNTPQGSLGGIWMSGQGLTVDTAGNVYFSTGNGSWAADGSQTGNSFVKLDPTLALQDWFTPYNVDNLNTGDQDLGTSGLLSIPNTSYVIGGGKQGVLYLVDTNNMTHFHAGADTIQQEFQGVFGTGTSHIHGGPIYYNSPVNGPTIFVWGENDYLRSYQFDPVAGLFNTGTLHQSAKTAPIISSSSAMPGGFLSLSSYNGQAGTGIIWAATPYKSNAVHTTVAGTVYAFDESTLQELWNDKQNAARDDIGNFAKFTPPTVAGGKVYMASFGATGSALGSGQLVVYGLLSVTPDFTLKTTVGGLGVTQGTSVSTNVTVTPVNGFSGRVTLAATGLPTGTTVIFGKNPTTKSSTVIFTTSATAATGTYTVTLTGTSGILRRTTTLTLTITVPTPNISVTLPPIADTFVQSGTSAALNFGQTTPVVVKIDPPNLTRYSYFKFDLSSITSKITSATLKVYGKRQGTNSSANDSSYGVTDNTWTELGMTWNNKPALGQKLSTTTVTSTGQYYPWDVTAFLQSQQAAGSTLATVALAMDTLPADRLADTFYSREAVRSTPQLALTVASPNYVSGFAGVSDLQLNGSASINNNLLRLTSGNSGEVGSAFFASPVNIQSFHTNFNFQLTNAVADGITFCIQGNSPTALGSLGGGLGYGPDPNAAGGSSIGNSAAIKFDLYSNTSEGINSTGLFTNGATPSVPSTDLTGTGIDLHSGDVIAVSIAYDGAKLAVVERDTTTGAATTQFYTVNLPALVGSTKGYVGFTAGCGSKTAIQDILNWSYGN